MQELPMITRDIFLNLSPIDHRYYLVNKSLFDKLSLYISEDANIRYCIKVEIALLKTHIKSEGFNDNFDAEFKKLDNLSSRIDIEEIYREEEKTNHNIRALVNVLTRYVPSKWRHFVHLGATSVDILDTASSLQYRDALINVIIPLLIDLENELIKLTLKESKTPQVGRTHGQHAVPITFGFAMAEYVARLGKSILKISEYAEDLRGKLSGAVGAYNAINLIVENSEHFETEFLNHFNLKPSEYSNQLVEPEYLLHLLLELNTAFGIIANLADDLRNLQRSEIGEVRESFTEGQVGSSTMPQKRNPWNSEHIKSLWKTFSPRVVTFFMDQLSDHQRDLTNSASKRFISDYFTGFSAAVSRMHKVISNLHVNRDRMYSNILLNGDLILAEAVYILLAKNGNRNAHEKIKQLTLKRENSNKKLWDIIRENTDLYNILEKELNETLHINGKDFWMNPEKYSGLSSLKADEIAKRYKELFSR